MEDKKNWWAQVLGKRGGSKGGLAKVPKGFAKMTLEQRAAAAKSGVDARQKKHPPKTSDTDNV